MTEPETAENRIADMEAQLDEMRRRLPQEKFEMSDEQREAERLKSLAAVYAERFGPAREYDPLVGLCNGPTITNPRPSISSELVQPKAWRG